MTALQELGMQRLVDRQVQSRAPLPLQASVKSARHRRVRQSQSSTLAAQSSGLTSSVELGPAEEQASSSSQEKASSIDQVNLESQVSINPLINYLKYQASEVYRSDLTCLLVRALATSLWINGSLLARLCTAGRRRLLSTA